MPIGIPEIIILSPIVLMPLFLLGLRRRAKKLGYPSTRTYLRAAPRNDEERRDAASLALKGLVLSLLGIIFAPLVLVGLVPLLYGVRKVLYATMGLGLVDDADQSDR